MILLHYGPVDMKCITMNVRLDGLLLLTFALVILNIVVYPIQGQTSEREKVKRRFSGDASIFEQNHQSSNDISNSKCQTASKRRRALRDNDISWMKRSSTFSAQIEQTTIPRERRQSSSGRKGRALYFSGIGEVLTLKSDVFQGEETAFLPRVNFTVEVWLKPEGGQSRDVNIIALRDICRPNSTNGWTLGISANTETAQGQGEGQGQGQNYDARFYFRLVTDRTNVGTTATSNQKYTPGKWSHLVATYNGSLIILFVNGAQVASVKGQQGALFARSLAECKSLRIGGDMKSSSLYRGALNNFRIWNKVLSHAEIIRSMYNSLNTTGELLIGSHLERKHELWRKAGLKTPGHVTMDQSDYDNDIGPVVPSCGETICDDPNIVTSYLYRWQLKQKKSLRYRIINVMNDNGTDAMVSREHIRLQDDALRVAYKRYNISWQLETMEVRNTSLRSKTVLFGCDPEKVADGFCQLECNHTATGYDGGDCYDVMANCDQDDVGNGVCDVTCNTAYEEWDGGDCCTSSDVDNCLDPASPYRRYLSIQEYKDLLDLTNEDALNVYFAHWTVSDTIGVATFPWDQATHTKQGGVVVHPDTYGAADKTLNLVHEFGHVLGLWHVHLGVSEMDCDDPCRETEASLSLGDLCADTEPTPMHRQCRDPDGISLAVSFLGIVGGSCGIREYKNTPYKNYMSYTGNGCADHFSKQQVARMHCYVDLVHSPWTDTRRPSPIPLVPRILASSNHSATLSWIPPIGSGSSTIDHVCSQCLNDYSLIQYANESTSPVALGFGYFGPQQTVGPPDAESCTKSSFTPYAWVPHRMAGPCFGDECRVELYLQYPVVVRRLSVWFPHVQDGAVERIDLVYTDNSVKSLQPITAYCDTPYTEELTGEKKRVYKVIVRSNNADVSVDALAVQSEENSAVCKRCPPLKYVITREPPFQKEDGTIATSIGSRDLVFTDSAIDDNATYSYAIHASLGTHVQPTESPVLVFTQGQPYCGDGHVDSGEQCDDGNHRNKDGCTLDCQKEDSFNCEGHYQNGPTTGEPSLCYNYYGDGICESFERTNNLVDCGHVTPVGYTDHWMTSATAGPGGIDPMFMGSCVPDAVIGPPTLLAPKCHRKPNPSVSWRPDCLRPPGRLSQQSYYLQMETSTPVVAGAVLVYLGTDKASLGHSNSQPLHMNVSLIGIGGRLTPLYDGSVNVTCTMTSEVLTVVHNLMDPLLETKGVRLEYESANLDVYAVALRTADWLQRSVHGNCHGNSYYDDAYQTCVTKETVCLSSGCERPAIKHADVVCSGHADGQSCSVTCKPGYASRGVEPFIRCTNGTWSGDIRCVPTDCGSPDIPYASIDCPDGTLLNNKCKFDCLPPARKQGNSHILQCKHDGLWSLPEGYCRILCPPLTKVKNATLTSGECAEGTQDLGTSCSLRCDRGFKVNDQIETGRNFELVCTANGMWDGPQCQQIQCSHLSPVFTGIYSCTNGFNAGSSCTIKCPGNNGVMSHVKCLKSGLWNRAPDECSVNNVWCPDLSDLVASGIISQCTNRSAGSTCRLSCEYPGYDIVAESSGGPGSPSIMYVFTLCTYTGTWIPSVTGVECQPKCEEYFIGDGYCDPSNNQDRCQWDGGDCCMSTSSSGFVSSCGPACLCKDPSAVENRDVANRVRRHHSSRRHVRQIKRHLTRKHKTRSTRTH